MRKWQVRFYQRECPDIVTDFFLGLEWRCEAISEAAKMMVEKYGEACFDVWVFGFCEVQHGV